MTEAKTRADFEVGWCQREMRTAQPLGFFRVLGLELGESLKLGDADGAVVDTEELHVGLLVELEAVLNVTTYGHLLRIGGQAAIGKDYIAGNGGAAAASGAD